MKWLTHIAFGALSVFLLASSAHAEVLGVKTVYLLPMAGGLDQYLALQLTSSGVLQVVTDPKKADAIMTDGIGARLEDRLSELYGTPLNKEKSETDKSGKVGTTDSGPSAIRPTSTSRGVVFLVNRDSRNVLWSTFERPNGTRPEELRHTASKIVSRLAKANTAK